MSSLGWADHPNQQPRPDPPTRSLPASHYADRHTRRQAPPGERAKQFEAFGQLVDERSLASRSS
jgi:hypothetical protein